MTIEEANELITEYVKLQKKAIKDTKYVKPFLSHEKLCIQKFEYIILMKTAKYKNFANYDDLNQEGRVALLKAFVSFNPKKKSNIFWWINKYVATRISRHANLHTAIRFPLKIAKETPPRRESNLPLLIDPAKGPEICAEHQEIWTRVRKSFHKLSTTQQQITYMMFGIEGEPQQSINRICEKMKISRPTCLKILDQVFDILKQNVKL